MTKQITIEEAQELESNDKDFSLEFDAWLCDNNIPHDRCHEKVPDWAWGCFVEEYYDIELIDY